MAEDWTAHKDGYRAVDRSDDENLKIELVFFANGEEKIDLLDPVRLFSAPSTEVNKVSFLRALDYARAACRFINSGGSRNTMYLIADIISQVPLAVSSEYELADYIPGKGATTVWKKDANSYIVVVDDEESGYTDELDSDGVERFLRELYTQ